MSFRSWLEDLFKPTYRIELRRGDTIVVEYVKGQEEAEEMFWYFVGTGSYSVVTMSKGKGAYLSYCRVKGES